MAVSGIHLRLIISKVSIDARTSNLAYDVINKRFFAKGEFFSSLFLR